MNIGIRLGAPVEPAFRSSERIREYYGDIRDYVSSEGLTSEGGMPCA